MHEDLKESQYYVGDLHVKAIYDTRHRLICIICAQTYDLTTERHVPYSDPETRGMACAICWNALP